MKGENYLEIGVKNGPNFLPIKVHNNGIKIGVDPNFKISKKQILKSLINNKYNINPQYYETTSDEFFKLNIKTKYFDCIFIDGLHTYEQSLKDVKNSLDRISEKGVIVLHDCFPPSYEYSHPQWSGDVYKTIIWLKTFRPDLEVFVLDCDFGVGIVRKRQTKSNSSLNLTEEIIATIGYDQLVENKALYLDIKPPQYLYTFMK